MAFLRAASLLFVDQLRRVARSKRLLLALVIALLPVGVAFFVVQVAQRVGEDPPATSIGWVLTVQVVVPILALLLGSAVVSEEIEDRTVTYLFTRPMPRAALLWGRWLASTAILVAILVATTWATLAVLRVGLEGTDAREAIDAGVRRPLLAVVALGGVVYSAVFAALGTVFKYPMILGLGYVFAFEGFLSNLPGKTQVLTIQHSLRRFVVAHGSEAWRTVDSFEHVVLEEGADPLRTLLLVWLVAMLAGSWILSRRQYVLPA